MKVDMPLKTKKENVKIYIVNTMFQNTIFTKYLKAKARTCLHERENKFTIEETNSKQIRISVAISLLCCKVQVFITQ